MFHEDRHIQQEIRRLKKLVRQNPLLCARLGDCYLRLGDGDHAESVLKEGLGQVRDYPNAYRVLAEIQFWKGFYRDAEASCRKGLQQNPNHLGLLHLLMRIKKKGDNDSEAGQLQRMIARLDPLYTPEYVIEADPSEEAADNPEMPAPAEIWKINAARRETPIEAESTAALQSATVFDISDAAPSPSEPSRDQGLEGPLPEGSNAKNGLELQKYLNEILGSTQKTDAGIEPGEPSDEAEAVPSGIATRTLAELYAKQGKYDEAIEVYRQLLDNDPDNESYQERLRELVKLQESDLENRKANQDG